MTTATTIHAITLATAQVLLEIFPRNADTHAFLRVTLCAVSGSPCALTATFSTSELALQGLHLRTLCVPPERVVFEPENGTLIVPHASGVARLHVSERLDSCLFVERVVTYLSFFEADVRREGELLRIVAGKKRQVLERVESMRDRRVVSNRTVRDALPVLMASKQGRSITTLYNR